MWVRTHPRIHEMKTGSNAELRRLTIYGSISAIAYGIDMGAFLLLINVADIGLVTSNVLGKMLSAVFSFSAHRRFTFPQVDKSKRLDQMMKYSLLVGLNIPIATAILALLNQWISPPALAKFIADLLCVVLSYLQTKYLVFSKAR